MIVCVFCGEIRGDGEDKKQFVCENCYHVIEPIVEARMWQLLRLKARRESTTAGNINKEDV
jgi:hypothetical protein